MDAFELFQKLLRILFYVCVVATLLCYAADQWFSMPNTYWIWFGMGAVGTSLIRFFLRFM